MRRGYFCLWSEPDRAVGRVKHSPKLLRTLRSRGPSRFAQGWERPYWTHLWGGLAVWKGAEERIVQLRDWKDCCKAVSMFAFPWEARVPSTTTAHTDLRSISGSCFVHLVRSYLCLRRRPKQQEGADL